MNYRYRKGAQNMHLHRIGAAALFLVLSLFVITTPSHADAPIRVNGTGSGVVLMKALVEAYAKENPQAVFDLQKSLGSSGAIKALGKGALDIAVSARPLTAKESGEGLAGLEYGRTPFVVITNRKYPHLAEIRHELLESIFNGRMAAWPNGPTVRLILRPLDDVDTKLTRAMSPEMDQGVTASHEHYPIVAITDADAFEMVKKTPGAITLIGLVMPLSEPRAVRLAKLDGVEPTLKNLASGKYRYYKEIFIVTKGQPAGALADFLKFIASSKGRAVAARSGVLVTLPAKAK
ncbi:substrate-binding domain-containing protein [Geomesophilobacter sediminis]|uniref:Substrate-binding domain-containing protein n=1 Tax=Geomesophilobacter sediminis TaxID=2798584 RepID=A0A8J7M0X2_9BACT|nr:substrate-binding domain-containing protein [Geomesophilobacter sediminis]MBJ6726574.1 substrate-binding domain-containing protein [Geomesophilobacter sediminis]